MPVSQILIATGFCEPSSSLTIPVSHYCSIKRNALEHLCSCLQAETNYRQVQEERRSTQHHLSSVQARIKAVAMEIEKAKRGTDAYLDLVTKENEIIKDEKDVLGKLSALEENEKHFFGLLSSALRESHEKERARAERMKYWGIMGSIIGAVIGILGTTINNYLRMKELRRLVTASAESNQSSREKMMELYVNVNDQYGKIYHFLTDIRSYMGIAAPGNAAAHKMETKELKTTTLNAETKLEALVESLKCQEQQLEKELEKLGQIMAVKQALADGSNSVVYVGPEIESLLKDSENSLDIKMKHALGTVTLVYAVGIVVLPFLWKLFGG